MFGIHVKVTMTRAVERAVNKARPKNLREAGAYVRKVVRASIKQRKDPNISSAPGTPPHSHRAKANPGFKRTIASGMWDNKTVLVGPKLVRAGLSNIARVHEFGGVQVLRGLDPKLDNGINIGDVAPVRGKFITRKDAVVSKDSRPDPRTGQKLFWIKIRTETQLLHAKRVYNRLKKKYGKNKRVYYPARPYMKPALMFSKRKLSSFWRSSVKSY